MVMQGIKRRVTVAGPHLAPVRRPHIGGNGLNVAVISRGYSVIQHQKTFMSGIRARTVMGVGSSDRTQTETTLSAMVGKTTILSSEKGRGGVPWGSLLRHLTVSSSSKETPTLA